MKKIGVAALLLFLCFNLKAQVNSPYSRYALGDLVSGQNIVNRGMGGVAAAYYDYRSVNFVNPASLANLKLTTFDVGFVYNTLTLRRKSPRQIQHRLTSASVFEPGGSIGQTFRTHFRTKTC
jgi:hypothetical protein